MAVQVARVAHLRVCMVNFRVNNQFGNLVTDDHGVAILGVVELKGLWWASLRPSSCHDPWNIGHVVVSRILTNVRSRDAIRDGDEDG